MSLLCLIFLATGIQQERRDAVDLLEELLGMPSMREIEAPFFSDSTGAVRFYFILSGIVCKGINSLLKITNVDALVEINSFRSNIGVTSGYKAPRVSNTFQFSLL